MSSYYRKFEQNEQKDEQKDKWEDKWENEWYQLDFGCIGFGCVILITLVSEVRLGFYKYNRFQHCSNMKYDEDDEYCLFYFDYDYCYDNPISPFECAFKCAWQALFFTTFISLGTLAIAAVVVPNPPVFFGVMMLATAATLEKERWSRAKFGGVARIFKI